MQIYTLQRKQVIPLTIQKTWDFFSNPRNLATITPPQLGFSITHGQHEEHIFTGKIISYKVKPMLGIPLTWVTEISDVRAPHFFIDKQLVGPYKLWSHKHFFKPVGKKTEMTDIVDYAVPGLWLSPLVHRWVVRPRLEAIFDFRRKKLVEIFGQ